ncbi:hypothetical protein [Treponema denticola]|uniref:hypothetical protein n=1 Tax=Treponema denticola TaxID=158 RepID=UPI0020A3B450|nr:hypothetical protein [Treponema denticola]
MLKNGTFSVDSVSVYEHPYIASGMRIAGTNGKAYTPAETVFPSPLRIFHKRVRNIMLVPINTQFASVFKIKTKGTARNYYLELIINTIPMYGKNY